MDRVYKCSGCGKEEIIDVWNVRNNMQCKNCGEIIKDYRESIYKMKSKKDKSQDNIYYECDPNKNKKCSKSRCHIYGAKCEGTKHKEFIKDNTRPFRMEPITIDGKIEFRKEYI